MVRTPQQKANTMTRSIFSVSNPSFTTYHVARDADAALVASYNVTGAYGQTLEAVAAGFGPDHTVDGLRKDQVVTYLDPEHLAEAFVADEEIGLDEYLTNVQDAAVKADADHITGIRAFDEFLAEVPRVNVQRHFFDLVDEIGIRDEFEDALRPLVEREIGRVLAKDGRDVFQVRDGLNLVSDGLANDERVEDFVDMHDLPVFGGDDASGDDIWSWDAEYVLTTGGDHRFTVVSREDVLAAA